MPKIHFLGYVWPRSFLFQAAPRDVRWKDGTANGAGLEATFKIRIANSIVSIEVEANRYVPEDAAELYKQAFDLARASINLISFATGKGALVILETLIDPSGTPTILLPEDSRLATICTAFQFGAKSENDVSMIVFTDVSVFRALNDLIECIWNPHVSCVNCGRVIDTIRRVITPVGTATTGQAWRAMHTALNVARDYQEWISHQAAGPRHGDPKFVSGDITTEVTIRTWKVMNRFLEYRRGGDKPLTSPEFPLLV